ncbi:hypothetical protein [Pontibaca salina]|uniref:Uncharacterized protein n=1 Tax=Pontibaca salina TaxID=2795731 RepID=A0A934HMG2_9RHOB|nr:hypothetical protein [Pontibaca salina]MBI6628277.1 hypothetical protein [Pontibaca salina]
MDYYERITAKHEQLLNRYGQGLIEIGRTETIDDPDDPFAPPITTTVWDAVPGIAGGFDSAFVDGSTILATDVRIQTVVPDVVPSPGDMVRIDNATPLTIVKADPLPGAGSPVGYVLQARRG